MMKNAYHEDLKTDVMKLLKEMKEVKQRLSLETSDARAEKTNDAGAGKTNGEEAAVHGDKVALTSEV